MAVPERELQNALRSMYRRVVKGAQLLDEVEPTWFCGVWMWRHFLDMRNPQFDIIRCSGLWHCFVGYQLDIHDQDTYCAHGFAPDGRYALPDETEAALLASKWLNQARQRMIAHKIPLDEFDGNI